MKKIKEIIIGTNNDGKYREICNLLPKETKKISIKDLKIPVPEETGKNFEENSMIKASYFSKKTNLICLSDDSGLEIDLLNGAPGIYSARWSGTNNNFDKAIEKVYKEMNKVKKNWKNDNSAKFICCLSLYWPGGKSHTSIGIVEGKISTEKKGNNGFGYDPIFIDPQMGKTTAELTREEKLTVSHRGKALRQLSRSLKQLLMQ